MSTTWTAGTIDASSVSEHSLIADEFWDVVFQPLTVGDFASRTRFVSLPGGLVYQETWNRPLRVTGELRPELIGFALPAPTPQPFRVWNEELSTPWRAPWLASGMGVEMTTDATYQNTILLFERRLFDRVSRELATGGEEPWEPAERFPRCHPRRARELHHIVRHLLAFAVGPPGPLQPLGGASLEESIIAAVAAAFRTDSGTNPSSDLDSSASRRRRLAETCLEYAAAENFQLSMPQLCAAVGKSERTLRYVFQENFGLAPIRYLRHCRFNGARRELAAAEPDATTVTEIATRWGFYELGRFAVDFRRLFNELPSEVLKRAPSRAARRIPRREA